MKSGKQRKQQLQKTRKDKAERQARAVVEPMPSQRPKDSAVVNIAALAPFNSYGPPDWYQRGYYLDKPFKCKDCGVDEVWTATQQKWWYEVAKGQPFSHAIRCRACRRTKRETKADARRRSGHTD